MSGRGLLTPAPHLPGLVWHRPRRAMAVASKAAKINEPAVGTETEGDAATAAGAVGQALILPGHPAAARAVGDTAFAGATAERETLIAGPVAMNEAGDAEAGDLAATAAAETGLAGR